MRMNSDSRSTLGEMLRQQRIVMPLTLRELSDMSGVSPSHLARIERGERFPSAHILRRIAQPLSFDENELFTLAGYLSPQSSVIAEENPGYSSGRVDPFVAKVLAQEPIEVQRAVISSGAD